MCEKSVCVLFEPPLGVCRARLPRSNVNHDPSLPNTDVPPAVVAKWMGKQGTQHGHYHRRATHGLFRRGGRDRCTAATPLGARYLSAQAQRAISLQQAERVKMTVMQGLSCRVCHAGFCHAG